MTDLGPQIYTLKSTPQRVADKLAGEVKYELTYRCCNATFKRRSFDPKQTCICHHCGVLRAAFEVWEI